MGERGSQIAAQAEQQISMTVEFLSGLTEADLRRRAFARIPAVFEDDGRIRLSADDPDLVRAVPSWEAKLFAYRALDQADPPRCQPAFLPAL